jgi:hypothetical protein
MLREECGAAFRLCARGGSCGLPWLGAIVASHLLGISVHDALIGMLKV